MKNGDFQSGFTADIDKAKCSECGLCQGLCRWNAINTDFEVNSVDCEGCGVCVYFCPEKAINFPINTCGEWFISDTRFGAMVHAHLGIAEENPGKLVTLVRQESRKLAEEKGLMCLRRIPFDPVFTEAMVQAQTVFEYNNGSKSGHAIRGIWNNLSNELVL